MIITCFEGTIVGVEDRRAQNSCLNYVMAPFTYQIQLLNSYS